jgi:AraC-like DNA-binding protein
MPTQPAILRIAPGMPPRALAAGLCLSRGTQFHPDRRIGEHELFFVRKGCLPIAESGRQLETRSGETLILWPNRRHYGTDTIPAGCEFYWLHFVVPPAPEGAAAMEVPQRGRPARPERLMELLHQFLHDQNLGRLTEVSGGALVLLMLSEICEQKPPALQVDATLASRAEAHIARGFHLAIGTSSIARELRCNPDYLGRLYHRVFGRSIMAAIAQRRVIEAKRLLLEQPGTAMEEIAHRCGCRNQAWFRRIFKRDAGCSPDQFRRTHIGGRINS